MKQALRKIRLLCDLDDGQLERIAAIASIERVKTGDIVVEEQGPANSIRAVAEGRVSIAVSVPGRGELPVCTVSVGEILGWSALLPQARWLATARAVKDTTLIVLRGAALLDLYEQDRELGYRVMHRTFETVAERLHDTWLQLMDSYRQ
ncbi:transcriptional activator FtrB [Enhygromyxa salina]|uniref:Transcriptional activator FtrB n=1 Tax=Enhygromyxa salina TaxID=215803 RepID=A0A2S9XUJ3_9BACT|nr:cyclic nucleotide-binding domain-containing protein [Enhygromyxa salina]PRP96547.1 transcriptional activator FtrB [Enhygromyxa salina]